MAIPIYDPYRREQPDLLGAIKIGLDQQLARERMMVDDARARQLAAQEERDNERRHQQQMAQFGLNEMKANYDMQQDQPGGLNYMKDMADIKASEAQAALASDRLRNPGRYPAGRSGYGAGRAQAAPKLTQPHLDQNESDRANRRPLTYPVGNTTVAATVPASSAGPPVYDMDLPVSGNSPAVDPWAVLDPIPPGTYDPAAEGGGTDLMPAPAAPASNEPPMLDAAPADPLLPAPYQPLDDPAARITLNKEREQRIAALNKQIASLTTSAASAEKAASESDPAKKEAFQQSADLFAVQLQKRQQELRNIVDPPWSPTNERGDGNKSQQTATDPPSTPKPPATTILGQAEELRNEANKGTNAAWASAKQTVMQAIGGRGAIIQELAKIEQPKSKKELSRVIQGMLAGRGVLGSDFDTADLSSLNLGPLPKNAKTHFDVADALAEDIYNEGGNAAGQNSANKSVPQSEMEAADRILESKQKPAAAK